MRRLLPLLAVAAVIAAGLVAMALDSGGPSRESARPAGEEPGTKPEVERKSRRELVLEAVREYAELVQESGGQAACRLFPDHFERSDRKVKPPMPDVPFPHPAPADGCRSREIPAFAQIPSAPWEGSTVERIGRLRFARGLARVTLRIRTEYGPAPRAGRIPDMVERDVVWLRPDGAEWRVAQPSLLAYRVFESLSTPPHLLDRPVPVNRLSRAARVPVANVGCPTPALTVGDPTAAADRREGVAPAPWVDMTRLGMSRARGTLCLTLRTAAPLRPSTRIEFYAEQAKPIFTSTVTSVRLDTRGRPHVTTNEPPPNASTDRRAPYEVKGARAGGMGRRVSIALPVKGLGLPRGRFAWMLNIFNEPHPGEVHRDQAPNTRARLFYTYPDGKLVRELPWR
ncbi:MAG TPA: hypothetical protein VHG69_06260 [Thermoleophilaceae bacterium]|nr:hypothetical protein [Thermoleophilaceae bacterium]